MFKLFPLYFTIETLGIAIVSGIIFTIFAILFHLISLLNWKIKSKSSNYGQDKIHPKLSRRKLKNAKSYNIAFEKSFMEMFKKECIKNQSTCASVLENLMKNYLNESNNNNDKKQ